MKVEYINPFIEASKNIFKTMFDADVILGKIYIKNSPYTVEDMIIMIGVVGDIRGQVCFEINLATAEKIVATMMNGMSVSGMDDIAKSAVAELGNMIMGNACTIYSKNKLNIDITPPTILTGDKINLSNKVATIGVPMEIQGFGTINITITAEQVL